jgi:hypothetical protein
MQIPNTNIFVIYAEYELFDRAQIAPQIVSQTKNKTGLIFTRYKYISTVPNFIMVQYKELLITGFQWAAKSGRGFAVLLMVQMYYHFIRKRRKSAHHFIRGKIWIPAKQSENCRIRTKIKCKESQKEKTSEKDCSISSGFRRVRKRRHQIRIAVLSAAFGVSFSREPPLTLAKRNFTAFKIRFQTSELFSTTL